MSIRERVKQGWWRLQKLWQANRNRTFVAFAFVFVIISLYSTSQMANSLREKELHEVHMWVTAMEQMSRVVALERLPSALDIASTRQNIPFIVLDDQMKVISSHLISSDILDHPDRLRNQVQTFVAENQPIVFQQMWSDDKYMLFYGSSQLLRRLYYVPITQFIITFIFFMLAYATLHSTKQGEQDRVWVGLAKETAHQLGTPISSLMGWIEHLRDENIDPTIVEEMTRDLTQLMKFTDRFSKIGSDTPLAPANLNEVVGGVVRYFRGRMPRSVSLNYDGLSMAPVQANINIILFEWVIENMLKNSLDAMQGSGELTVSISVNDNDIEVDVKDTGRGIPKSSWRKIFEPGFTTKTRGWGLGLSLSRRIIEDYHHGRISVVESQIGVGTTIRIKLKRIFV